MSSFQRCNQKLTLSITFEDTVTFPMSVRAGSFFKSGNWAVLSMVVACSNQQIENQKVEMVSRLYKMILLLNKHNLIHVFMCYCLSVGHTEARNCTRALKLSFGQFIFLALRNISEALAEPIILKLCTHTGLYTLHKYVQHYFHISFCFS